MKINWGTAIVIAFIAFIGFIMYFVITMSTDKSLDHDLVVEDYYQQELAYQDEVNKIENAKNLTTNISYMTTNKGLQIHFPKDLDHNRITGKVFLYRPSNKRLDIELPISLSNHILLIPDNQLLDGRWNLKVDWSYNNEAYLFKSDIVY